MVCQDDIGMEQGYFLYSLDVQIPVEIDAACPAQKGMSHTVGYVHDISPEEYILSMVIQHDKCYLMYINVLPTNYL